MKHWFTLPKELRDQVWEAYRPGQEITKTPSDEYLLVANEVHRWAVDHEARGRQAGTPMAGPSAAPSTSLPTQQLGLDF